MKIVQLSRFAGPQGLQIIDTQVPEPGAGQVRVRVASAGVNFFEALMLDDRYRDRPVLPAHLGVEVAGTVDAVGMGVAAPPLGARVAVPLFITERPFGGYAEFIVVEARDLVKLPDALSFDAATALLVQGLTARGLVRRAQVRGKSVVVTAAAGGVGSLAVQMARTQGAIKVIALASSQEKRDWLSTLGVDLAIDYQADWTAQVLEETQGRGADVVVDLVGGEISRLGLSATADGGVLLLAAMGRFGLSLTEIDDAMARNQSVTGFALLPYLSTIDVRAELTDLFAQAADGRLQVRIGGAWPLSEARAAHEAILSRQSLGKVVLRP